MSINARIEASRKAALKPARSTMLVAISKTFGPEAIRPAIDAGQRVFGENRVQEARAKWPPLKGEFPDIELHLVGPLQSNKTRTAAEHFDWVHSVDRLKVAQRLSEHRPAHLPPRFAAVCVTPSITTPGNVTPTGPSQEK